MLILVCVLSNINDETYVKIPLQIATMIPQSAVDKKNESVTLLKAMTKTHLDCHHDFIYCYKFSK